MYWRMLINLNSSDRLGLATAVGGLSRTAPPSALAGKNIGQQPQLGFSAQIKQHLYIRMSVKYTKFVTRPLLDIQPPSPTLHPLHKLRRGLLLEHSPVGFVQSNAIFGT